MNDQTMPAAREERRSIAQLLNGDDTRKKFAAALPRHLSVDRMLRVASLAVYKTPKLAECTPGSLLGAMLVCASLGFEPNTPLGHAYLIPFEKRRKDGNRWVTERVDVNLIIGYKGFIDLARRSGNLVSLHADVVYPDDDFDFCYGSEHFLRHRPTGRRDDGGDGLVPDPLWAYAFAKLTDGEDFEVLPWSKVMKIRNGSQAYRNATGHWRSKPDETTPWIAWTDEMAKKTAIRALAKTLPMSIEFMHAATLDARGEGQRLDFSGIAQEGIGSDGFDANAIEDMRDEPDDIPDITPEDRDKPADKPAPAAAPRQADQPLKYLKDIRAHAADAGSEGERRAPPAGLSDEGRNAWLEEYDRAAEKARAEMAGAADADERASAPDLPADDDQRFEE